MVDSLIRMTKNTNHLDSSALTDVFQFNLRYTIANRICFVVQMRLAVNEDPYEQATRDD